MNIFVLKKQSEKTKKAYTALYVQIDDSIYALNFDMALIATIADKSPRFIQNMKVGDKINIGQIVNK